MGKMHNTITHKLINHKTAPFLEKLELAKANPLNIVLEGENGVGKEYFARQIHKKRDWTKNFVIFDWECDYSCQLRILETLSTNHLSAILDINNKNRDTYFFRRIDHLSSRIQLEIFELLETKARAVGLSRSQFHQLGLIASVEKSSETAERKKNIITTQFLELFPLKIRIPPIRYRRMELLSLMNMLLKSVNKQLNRRILDFSPETYNLFLAYDWPNNIDELRSEIEREVALTEDDHLIRPGVLSERLTKHKSILSTENITR